METAKLVIVGAIDNEVEYNDKHSVFFQDTFKPTECERSPSVS